MARSTKSIVPKATGIRTKRDALLRVRLILANPARWIKGKWAGHRTSPKGYPNYIDMDKPKSEPNCFCLDGAFRYLKQNATSRQQVLIDEAETTVVGVLKGDRKLGRGIISFNDDKKTRHRDIMRLLNDAIKKATPKCTPTKSSTQKVTTSTRTKSFKRSVTKTSKSS